MAKIIKRLALPVGSYTKQGDSKPKIEYRDIGVVMEYEDQQGSRWQEVKLNLDILNPSLLLLARGMADKGSASARVKMFDLPARQKREEAETEEAAATGEEDAIPY